MERSSEELQKPDSASLQRAPVPQLLRPPALPPPHRAHQPSLHRVHCRYPTRGKTSPQVRRARECPLRRARQAPPPALATEGHQPRLPALGVLHGKSKSSSNERENQNHSEITVSATRSFAHGEEQQRRIEHQIRVGFCGSDIAVHAWQARRERRTKYERRPGDPGRLPTFVCASISERRRSPIGAPDYWQTPNAQVPDMLPFMHCVPLGTAGFEQVPVADAQVAARWH